MHDMIYRQAAIDRYCEHECGKGMNRKNCGAINCGTIFDDLPSAQPELNEWCHDCKEYDKDRHCCPRFNRVIQQTVEEIKAEQPELIRCKDCKNWDTTWTNDFAPNYHYCPMIDGTRKSDFYCADAERRTDV